MQPPIPVIAVLPPTDLQNRILDEATWERLRGLGTVAANSRAEKLTEAQAAELLAGADACIGCWGMVKLTEELLDRAPRLKLVAYAAGSVKYFVTDAVWERGIRVTSTSAAIAVDVAEAVVALMVVSLKGVFQHNRWTHEGHWRQPPGVYCREMRGQTVGLVGAGHVGRNVIRLLRGYECRILLHDPYVTDEAASQLGVTRVGLDRLLTESDVVSLHTPITDETHHLLNARNLPLLKDGAIFINSARGWLVDEAALVKELETGRIFACIDVTDPEPPAPDHPFRRLENVILTPHITGSVGCCTRQGEMAAEEIRRCFAGEPLRYEVTREGLARMG